MFIVDRIEGDVVLVEFNNRILEIPLNDIIGEIKEGSVLSLTVNIKETENRKKDIKNRLNYLINKNKE